MSLTSSLHNALSGLNVAAKSAELISSNVANALTPGYARREVSLSSDMTMSGGVRFNGITRHENAAALAEVRLNSASVAASSTTSDFYARLIGAVGDIGADFSLSQDVANLSAALTVATGDPLDETRLSDVVNKSKTLVERFHSVSNVIQSERQTADQGIANTVSELNDSLKQLEYISTHLLRVEKGSSHHAALLDQRNQILDKVGESVSAKVFDRPNGTFAVYSASGTALMDIEAAHIDFETTASIGANSASVGQLSINGRSISADRKLSGGRLEALFNIRDVVAPAAQSQLDQMAFGVAKMTQDADPGGVGLFTDRSNALDPALVSGFAGRIGVNNAVDPDKLGDVNLLRQGISTPTTSSRESPYLSTLEDNMADNFSEASAVFTTKLNTEKQFSEQDYSFALAVQSELLAEAQSDGVNTDTEMQNLMVIERAYAANAKVLAAVDELLDQLLRIG